MALTIAIKVILATLLVLGSWASITMSRTMNDMSISTRHEKWMAKHGRVYKDNVEKSRRLKIFKDNVEFIEAFNRDGNRPYKLAVNHFADLTNEEFRASRNGHRSPSQLTTSTRKTPFKYENATSIPSIMDWRKKGAVNAIRDQGHCGCCWAFSAIAATEGVTKLKTGKLVSLSEQELVDCDQGSHGCEGGLMVTAFEYIAKNKGIDSESTYPYNGVDGTCHTEKVASPAAKITGYEKVPPNDEKSLLKAVANQPVSVAIDAGGSDFQFYSSGIFTGECGTKLDHGVTAVGYGTSNGTDYWLVRNSWGASWGEEGYIRMQRGVRAKEGLCGIAMDASYPTASNIYELKMKIT